MRPRLLAARRTVRPAIGAGLALGLLVFASSAAGRERLRIRGGAEFVNVAVVRGDALEVSGGVVDELGKPIDEAEVSLSVSPEEASAAAACRGGDRVRAAGASVFVTTDDVGFFCVRLSRDAAIESASLRYAGDPYHSGASAAVPREAGKRRLSLAFEHGELTASLDEKSFIVTVTPRSVDGTGGSAPVRLVLLHARTGSQAPNAAPQNPAESELAAVDVPLGTPARFDVETALLGPPGAGRLVARFLGSSAYAPAEASVLLQREATARLTLAAEVAPADPSDGVEILVGVGSAAGAVPNGVVEATVDDRSVGLGNVVEGAARVLATFTPVRGRPSIAVLRYVPSGRGFVAGAPITAVIPLRAASPLRAVPWLLFAATITYLVVRAWRRPARTERHRDADGTMSRGRAVVEVVETSSGATGHRGQVVDAHEGTPVASARVSIVVPTFDGEGIAASHVADRNGGFSLPYVLASKNEGARLVVTAPFHATLSGPVPPQGVLTVSLVSRRRALLERIVAWADRAGRPWSRRKEPTPLELADVARHRERGDVADWATAIAEAAYGARPPDERTERDLTGGEPPLPAPAPADAERHDRSD